MPFNKDDYVMGAIKRPKQALDKQKVPKPPAAQWVDWAGLEQKAQAAQEQARLNAEAQRMAERVRVNVLPGQIHWADQQFGAGDRVGGVVNVGDIGRAGGGGGVQVVEVPFDPPPVDRVALANGQLGRIAGVDFKVPVPLPDPLDDLMEKGIVKKVKDDWFDYEDRKKEVPMKAKSEIEGEPAKTEWVFLHNELMSYLDNKQKKVMHPIMKKQKSHGGFYLRGAFLAVKDNFPFLVYAGKGRDKRSVIGELFEVSQECLEELTRREKIGPIKRRTIRLDGGITAKAFIVNPMNLPEGTTTLNEQNYADYLRQQLEVDEESVLNEGE